MSKKIIKLPIKPAPFEGNSVFVSTLLFYSILEMAKVPRGLRLKKRENTEVMNL